MNRIQKFITIFSISSSIAYGSIAYIDYIDYQQFKDFAINRGPNYKVGNQKIVIPKKDGTFFEYNIPMPDFSSTDKSGVGTLISPTYITSVAHNKGYATVTYGYGTGHTYGLIARNNHSNGDYDFHIPRLNKVVTDVVPSYVDFTKDTLYDYRNDFELFARVGSGTQMTSLNGNVTKVADAYQYLTGGLFLPSDFNYYDNYYQGLMINYPNSSGPLSTVTEGGDSGSPIWGYHKTEKRWILLGVLRGTTTLHNGQDVMLFKRIETTYYRNILEQNSLPEIVNTDSNAEFVWHGITAGSGINENTGKGEIVQGKNKWEYNGLKLEYNINQKDFGGDSQFSKDMNFTKHLTFSGEDGKIKLEDSINMGAGMLTFKSNYTVTSDTKNKTWVGAGILVEKDKKVIWEVNGVEGDYLHKIGEGTLVAQGSGDNKGSLNIGDGTVILNQTGGKAFDKIDIVSGRGTVKIANQENADALDTSKIWFGFRGGTLDMNGTNLTFGDIRASDTGAVITNTSDTKSTLTMDSGKFSSKYSSNGYNSIYHGQFGTADKAANMDIKLVNSKNEPRDKAAFTGGMNITGDISVSDTMLLIMSGDYNPNVGDAVKSKYDTSCYSTSVFKFNTLRLEKAYTDFYGGVYSDITGNIETTGTNEVILGYDGRNTGFIYDTGIGTDTQYAVFETYYNEESAAVFKQITTRFQGDITLKNSSKLRLGWTEMIGNVDSDNSSINLWSSNVTGNFNLKNHSSFSANSSQVKGQITNDGTSTVDNSSATFSNSLWSITGNSSISNLSLDKSVISFENLNDNSRAGIEFNNIKTNNLSGNGKVIFRADLATGESDKFIINEKTNNSTLKVLIDNVTGSNEIALGTTISLISKKEGENLNITSLTEDGYLDVGSIKGQLDNNGNLILPSAPKIKNNQNIWVSDMTNAALSDFTAKINLIKTQNELVGDILSDMGSENYKDGISYVGNFSNRLYRSDKFNQFEQNIVNNALSYQTKLFSNENWSNYLGVSFIYGMGSSKFKGDYKGELESFTESIFTKLAHKDGYFFTGNIGGTYLKDKINGDRYETFTGTFGLGTGWEKRFGNLKLTTGLDLATYYISGENYYLQDQTSFSSYKRTGVETNDEYLLQLQPNVKLGYNYKYKKLDLGVYGKIGYDYNKYILNSAPELKMADINVPLQTGLIENGFKFETGVEAEILSFKLSLGLVYFTGENKTENLFTNVKFRYLF